MKPCCDICKFVDFDVKWHDLDGTCPYVMVCSKDPQRASIDLKSDTAPGCSQFEPMDEEAQEYMCLNLGCDPGMCKNFCGMRIRPRVERLTIDTSIGTITTKEKTFYELRDIMDWAAHYLDQGYSDEDYQKSNILNDVSSQINWALREKEKVDEERIYHGDD